MLILVALVVTLLVSPVADPVAEAATKRRVGLAAPVMIDDTTALLRGRVKPAKRRVALQAKQGRRWVTVDRLRVRKKRFSVSVSRPESTVRVRVKAGRVASRVRRVPAVPSQVENGSPEPEPASPKSEAPKPETPAPEIPEPEAPEPETPEPEDPRDACGDQPQKADGSYWSCTFVDDFEGTELDRSKWLAQTVFASGDKLGDYACYQDDSDNVSVSDGALHLTLREEDEPAPCALGDRDPTRYTSGSVATYHRFSQAYGRFEARYKNTETQVSGLQEAFWLWPDDRNLLSVLWPAAGEIDIVETYSAFPDYAIPFLHYNENDNGGAIPGLNTAWHCLASRGEYNTYALEWSRNRLELFVNGTSCLVNESGNSAFQYPYILALTQLMGVGNNPFTENTPLPATMSVDYVRVWK